MLTLLLSALLTLTLLTAPVDGADGGQAGGTVATVAGSGKAEFTGDGGPATEAGVGGPFGIVVGPDGALYICETTNHVVRRLDRQTGNLTTVAGSGPLGFWKTISNLRRSIVPAVVFTCSALTVLTTILISVCGAT